MSFLNKSINQELEKEQYEAVYQIMIAIDNLGERVFGKDRKGSYSITDTKLNIRDAKHYLESIVNNDS